MDVDCDLSQSAGIKNRSAQVDFRTDLATYLNNANKPADADSPDIADAIDLDDFSYIDSSEDTDDDVKITLVQKNTTTKISRKYNSKEPINIDSSSEEDEVIVKKSLIIICSDDEDEIRETVRGNIPCENTIRDCVRIQKVNFPVRGNIPCENTIRDCVRIQKVNFPEIIVKEIVDKLVKDATEILQQERHTLPEEEKAIDNKTIIVCSNKDEIKENFRENIQNVNFPCDNNSTEMFVKKIVEKLIEDAAKLIDEECQISEVEKVIDNKTIVIFSDKHQIKEDFKENLSHCNTYENCVIMQNVNCPCDNSSVEVVIKTIVEKLVEDTIEIIQKECEEVDWSSSDNCLPEIKSTTLPSILQEKAEVNSHIHTISNEVSPEEILDDNEEDIVLTTDVHLDKVGVIDGVVEKNVIVQSNKDAPALDFESAFFFEDRVYMGKIIETFGPVKGPYYTVCLSSKIDSSKLSKGTKVFFAPFNQEFTKYVFVEKLKKQKGSDASWKNDCEPPSDRLDHSDDEEESRVRREQGNQSNDNTKNYGKFGQTPQQNNDNTKNYDNFGQTPQQNNGNMQRRGKFRQNQRKPNQRLNATNYNQTRNRHNQYNFHTPNAPVPPFPSQFTQPPRFSSNFNQIIPPAKICKTSQNQSNIIPQQSSPPFNIARHQQVHLPPQNGLPSNVQRESFPLPVPSRPRPAYATPLDAHLEIFPIANNLPLRTDINVDMPTRGILPEPFVNTGQPPISALHQNLFPPPAVNNMYSTIQHPRFHMRDFQDISLSSQNMGPGNIRHGKIVNINGFRLRR